MKNILLFACIITTTFLNAQGNSISIKVQKQALSVDLNEDNNDKHLVLNGSKVSKNDKFIIYNSNKTEAKTWKRSFTIYDKADNEIVKLLSTSKGTIYQIPLTTVSAKLKKNATYFLYTIALPGDPKKAAVVRVRRVLVCKIEMK